MKDNTIEKAYYICGYYVYKKILVCDREPRNTANRYAVAVKKDGIGTCPQRCHVYVHFTCGEEKSFTVQSQEEGTGDLPQGGLLKFPLFWHFNAEQSQRMNPFVGYC